MFESLEAHAQQLVEFVRAHEAWAAPVVFVLAFGESLAFISLLVPAWAALVGIGVLISTGELSFWPVWVAGAVGAALGDWLSYWIGVKLGPPVAHIWPLSRHPDLLPFFRSAARIGAAGRRHFSHADLAIPDCELHLGLRMGGGAAHDGGLRRQVHQVDMGVRRKCNASGGAGRVGSVRTIR